MRNEERVKELFSVKFPKSKTMPSKSVKESRMVIKLALRVFPKRRHIIASVNADDGVDGDEVLGRDAPRGGLFEPGAESRSYLGGNNDVDITLILLVLFEDDVLASVSRITCAGQWVPSS